jgi:hypothetical protein
MSDMIEIGYWDIRGLAVSQDLGLAPMFHSLRMRHSKDNIA